jgi:hypothetical protein
MAQTLDHLAPRARLFSVLARSAPFKPHDGSRFSFPDHTFDGGNGFEASDCGDGNSHILSRFGNFVQALACAFHVQAAITLRAVADFFVEQHKRAWTVASVT